METDTDFDLFTKGRVSMFVADSRFGTRGEWTMEIGGGLFGSWIAPGEMRDNPEFKQAVHELLAEAGTSLGANKLIDAARKRDAVVRQRVARHLLNVYANDPTDPLERGSEGRGYVLRKSV
jgi:hypothetical protein